ncbi:MAG: ABC transporter ATP-binding protein [Spirochaetaceae bacterium]|jgi:peptide/nickel transport system ATP-binding protein|nr:ABC transporter ATP-binding protein [Spirochaetaceae bacterium]
MPLSVESESVLEVKNLVKHFPLRSFGFGKQNGVVHAVDRVSFNISAGQTFSIVGESGCGKSTIGRTIMRLYPPSSGEVLFKGENIFTLPRKSLAAIRPKMQMIFQDPYASMDPRMTAGELVAEAVEKHGIVPPKQLWDYVITVMKDCGLSEKQAERFPHEFSGGQRQRICIARALALQPELIVCDEPVSALDVSIQAQIINLLRTLQQERGIAYLFISHDLAVVKHVSDNVAVMYLGEIVEQADKRTLYTLPIHPYTKALLKAVPMLRPGAALNPLVLSGEVPSAEHPPPGCRFHTRCPECMDLCTRESPKPQVLSLNHWVACHQYNEPSQKLIS